MITRDAVGRAATGLPLDVVPRLHALAIELLAERDEAIRKMEAVCGAAKKVIDSTHNYNVFADPDFVKELEDTLEASRLLAERKP